MPRERPSVPDLIDYEGVMARLCCSRSAVKRLVDKGKLPPPHHAVGLGPRWFVDEIEDYLCELRAERIAARRKSAQGQ